MFVPAYPIAKYHSVTLSKYTVNVRSSVHLKPYPIDTLSPCPSLKVLSHWQPINSPALRPVHSRIQNISLSNNILSPFPSFKFLSQQQPTNVLFQWLESDMEEGMWVLFVTDDAVNTARIYRIMSVVYDCLHFMTISYPIVMVQTLLWVMVEWSDVNVV